MKGETKTETTERPAEPIIPPEITELLERRGTFQGWLTKLGKLSGEVRPEVHEKIRKDYRGRLEEVEERLGSHLAGLESSLEERRSRVEELESDREARAAELEEAEVRHAVGEYSEEEWARRREEGKQGLAEVDRRLEVEQDARGQLEEVIAELTGVEESRDEGAGASRPVAAASGSPGSDEVAPDEALTAQPTGGPVGAGSEPEPDDASSAEPEPEPAEPGAPGPEPAESAAPEPEPSRRESSGADRPDSEDELDFLESLSLRQPEDLDTLSHLLDEEESGSGSRERSPGGGKQRGG